MQSRAYTENFSVYTNAGNFLASLASAREKSGSRDYTFWHVYNYYNCKFAREWLGARD